MASSIQFFKIVTQRSLEGRELIFPKKFISRYAKALSSPVFLKLPNDTEWRVELIISNGLVGMRRGWHEFAEYFSLEYGSFLVFRYDGNSSFHVSIFDKTGLEIEYPCKDAHGCKFEAATEFPDDDSVEILDDVPKRLQKMRKPTLPHFQPLKKMRKEDPYSSNLKLEEELNIAKEGCEGKAGFKKRSKHKIAGRRKSLPAAAEVNEKSEEVTFKVVMRPSYVRGKFTLAIPIAFARRYFVNQTGSIIIQNSDGRTWPLRYRWFGERFAYISCGWKAFAESNFVEEGDVGIFKLIEQDKLLFTKEETSSLPRVKLGNSGTYNINAKADERNNINGKVGKPRPSNPPPAREGKNGCSLTSGFCDVKEEPARKGNNGGISSPSSGFCEIKKQPADFEELPTTSKRANKGSAAANLKKVAAMASSSRKVKAASGFKTNKPFFEVLMHINGKACLNVPVDFAREHFPEEEGCAKLYARRGLWTVHMKRHGNRYRFCRGWPKFYTDNALKKGDICVFEMISINDFALKVTFFNPKAISLK